MVSVNLHDFVYALCCGQPDSQTIQLLGTAWLAGPGLVVTAAHVLDDAHEEHFFLTSPSILRQTGVMVKADVLHRDHDLDLAVLAAPALKMQTELSVGNFHVNTAESVTCVEYSPSIFLAGKTVLYSRTNTGNVTMTYAQHPDAGGKRKGAGMLEVSFVTLKGASGAPVLHNTGSSMEVWGVVIANANADLAPGLVVEELEEDNELLRSVRYTLPRGLAVSGEHLPGLLSAAQRGLS